MFHLKLLRYILYAFPVFSLILFYTYCVPVFRPPTQLASEVLDKAEEEEEDNQEIEEEDGEIDEMVMPYDIRLDTMALLTCDSSADIPGNNFKFRAGAFLKEIYEGGGGIKLRSPFVGLDKDTIKEYPYHNTLPSIFFGSAAGGLFQRRSILENIQLKNYIDELSEGYTHKFGSKFIDFKFPLTDIPSSALDQFFEDPVLATFTQRNENSPSVYTDDSGDQEIHGRAYKIEIDEEESFFTIRGVTETYPLLSKTYEWKCDIGDTPNVFKVYRHEALRYKTDDETLVEEGCIEDDSKDRALHKLARLLLGKDWVINTRRRCISPKSRNKSCYGLRPERVSFSNDCRGSHQGYHCPHYFSICTLNELQ